MFTLVAYVVLLVVFAGLVAAATDLADQRNQARATAEAEARTLRFQRDVWKRKAFLTERRLADAVALAEDAPAPVVPLIPAQRTGHEPWPPVARAVAEETTPIHDGLAVETFVEQIEAWGMEADQ